MARLKTAGKIALLGLAAFLAAFAAGLTPAARSYPLAIGVSVVLCPGALGFLGARFLRLWGGPALAPLNALPVLSALDDVFRLGDPVQARWLLASALFSWAGW